MKKSLIACAALAACFALPSLAQQQITVVNFGGANANAQKKAFYEPYEKQGNKIVAVEYNGEQAKVKAMVETKKVTWDVVEVESPDAARGCDEGLYEKLDYSKIVPKADLLPAAVNECAVASSCGPPSWPTTATSSRPRPRAGLTFGTPRRSLASAACARAPATTLNLHCWPME